MDLYGITFGGIELNNKEFSEVTLHNFENMPDVENNVEQVIAAHRSVESGRWYTKRSVTVELLAYGCTPQIQAKLARLRQVVQSQQKLVLDRGLPKKTGNVWAYDQWRSLEYRSTVLDSFAPEITGMLVRVVLTFQVLDPIAVDPTPVTLLNTSSTEDNVYIDLTGATIAGTFQTQYPVYSIGVTSVTGTGTVSISNQYNTIVYSGALEAGDTLVLDTYEASLELNGNLTDYSGSVPSLPQTGAILNIANTYSERDFSYSITNQPRYI